MVENQRNLQFSILNVFNLLNWNFSFWIIESLTESYVDAWLDAGDRLTHLGNGTYKQTVATNVADLVATNENDE